ncbi:MAG: ABC transporter permease [Verrucomicrobia bacterium]|nr:ABC transporter permease [Verrucomicrobiota bacterium]
MLFCLLAVWSPTFLSGYTMFVLARQVAFYALIALAQALCLVVGGMNLSVGAIGSMATVLLGLGLDPWGLSPWLAVPLTLGFGLASGWLNGVLIARLKLDSFIVTLSMMFLYMGLRSGISGGQSYRVPESFTWAGQSEFAGVPLVFLVAVAVLAIMAWVFHQTVFGRYLLATGERHGGASLGRADRPDDRLGECVVRRVCVAGCGALGLATRRCRPGDGRYLADRVLCGRDHWGHRSERRGDLGVWTADGRGDLPADQARSGRGQGQPVFRERLSRAVDPAHRGGGPRPRNVCRASSRARPSEPVARRRANPGGMPDAVSRELWHPLRLLLGRLRRCHGRSYPGTGMQEAEWGLQKRYPSRSAQGP